MPGKSVAIEITEGLLLDAEVNEKLLTFRDAGIGVSTDDSRAIAGGPWCPAAAGAAVFAWGERRHATQCFFIVLL